MSASPSSAIANTFPWVFDCCHDRRVVYIPGWGFVDATSRSVAVVLLLFLAHLALLDAAWLALRTLRRRRRSDSPHCGCLYRLRNCASTLRTLYAVLMGACALLVAGVWLVWVYHEVQWSKHASVQPLGASQVNTHYCVCAGSTHQHGILSALFQQKGLPHTNARRFSCSHVQYLIQLLDTLAVFLK